VLKPEKFCLLHHKYAVKYKDPVDHTNDKQDTTPPRVEEELNLGRDIEIYPDHPQDLSKYFNHSVFCYFI